MVRRWIRRRAISRGGCIDLRTSFDRGYLCDVCAAFDGGYHDLDDRLGVLCGITADHQISTSILYVNRQIYIEASQVLYTTNPITFDINAECVIRALRSLPSTARSHIRHLGFGHHSTIADEQDCTDY